LSFLSFTFTLYSSIHFLITATSPSVSLMGILSAYLNSLWQTKHADAFTSLSAFALSTWPHPRSAKNWYLPLNLM
jgi:hypothetical protein